MSEPNPYSTAWTPKRPVLAGFCADLASEFGLSPTLVRTVVLLFAFLPTGFTYMALAFLAERGGRRAARAAPAGPPSYSPALAGLRDRLRALEPRLSAMEAFVSSRDFELHKGFRKMGQ